MKKEKTEKYIDKLIEIGIFKIGNRQLYECSEREVKQVLFRSLLQKRRDRVRSM